MFQAETWVRIVVSESEPAMFKDYTLKEGTSCVNALEFTANFSSIDALTLILMQSISA